MSNIFNKIVQTDEFREEYFVAEAQARLANILEEKGVTRAELARKLDISRARVTQIFSDDATNLTLRLLARSYLALGEEPIVMTKREYERLQRRARHSQSEQRKRVGHTDENQEVLTASLIAELMRSTSGGHTGESEKTSRGNENARNWLEEGSNVISVPFGRTANG
ncbi:helix-turn-helix domain-containing protein [Pontixanthobacter sp.]|uniref:helix-turn-helix domain-containing protein n=1 Tax=Pontixanthobacter sp. TaxID=2792078 RepID=UPI003C79F378